MVKILVSIGILLCWLLGFSVGVYFISMMIDEKKMVGSLPKVETSLAIIFNGVSLLGLISIIYLMGWILWS